MGYRIIIMKFEIIINIVNYMFIPYRIIQVKQRKKQSLRKADINTKINTDELFQHCKPKPQKLTIYDSINKEKQLNQSILNKNKEKKIKNCQKQQDNFYKTISFSKNNNNLSLQHKGSFDVNKKSDRYKKIINDKTPKRCSTALNKKRQNIVTQNENIQTQVKFEKNHASCSINKQYKNQRRKMFFSIDLDRQCKNRGQSSFVRFDQTKSFNASASFKLQKSINPQSSKQIDENAFEFYVNLLYNKRKRKLSNQINLPKSNGLQINSYPRGRSQYSVDKKQEIQELFKNWRNTRNMSISGRSIIVSKIKQNNLEFTKKNVDDKSSKKTKKKEKKQNNFIGLMEGQIKAWPNQAHQDDIQQIQFS